MGAGALLRSRRAEDRVSITLVNPDRALVIRPRLYEADLSVSASRFATCSRRSVSSSAWHKSKPSTRSAEPHPRWGSPGELEYDQLVLCAGSWLRLPDGFESVHCADTYEQAVALHEAVARAWGNAPGATPSVTIVGCGASPTRVGR